MMNVILACLAFLLAAGLSLRAQTNAAAYDWQGHEQRIDRLFEPGVASILKGEREAIEAVLPREKADRYMKYFEDGLRSGTGAIMIEGGENRWLEIAFREGFARKQLFRKGYFQGLIRAAESNEPGPRSTTQTPGLPEPLVASWGRQKEFFITNNFEILEWEAAKAELLKGGLRGGKQYHTGWLTIYTAGGRKLLTQQPAMDAFFDFMKQSRLPTAGFGTE
jgi:hypothetical protein